MTYLRDLRPASISSKQDIGTKKIEYIFFLLPTGYIPTTNLSMQTISDLNAITPVLLSAASGMFFDYDRMKLKYLPGMRTEIPSEMLETPEAHHIASLLKDWCFKVKGRNGKVCNALGKELLKYNLLNNCGYLYVHTVNSPCSSGYIDKKGLMDQRGATFAQLSAYDVPKRLKIDGRDEIYLASNLNSNLTFGDLLKMISIIDVFGLSMPIQDIIFEIPSSPKRIFDVKLNEGNQYNLRVKLVYNEGDNI